MAEKSRWPTGEGTGTGTQDVRAIVCAGRLLGFRFLWLRGLGVWGFRVSVVDVVSCGTWCLLVDGAARQRPT